MTNFYGPTADQLAEASVTLQAERAAMWRQIQHNQVGSVALKPNDALPQAESLQHPTVGDEVARMGVEAIHEETEA